MSAAACLDDELVRARRGELSAEETRALRAHLATCAACRMSAALGRAVGPLPPPDAEDEAMAGRLVARLLGGGVEAAQRPAGVMADAVALALPAGRVVALPVRVRRWRGRTLALAASLLLMASVASAAYWTVHLKAARHAAERAAWTPPAGATTRTLPLPAGPAVDRLPPSRPTIEGRPTVAPASVQPPVRAPQTAALSPETLLRDANEARRARHNDEAVRLYRGLQARFPSSREAVLSRLSLGNLLLSRGAFADALEQFRAYARASGDGAELAEEALLGEARALEALGRPADERAVWLALQARFPKSEYSWRARQRLRELDRGAAP